MPKEAVTRKKAVQTLEKDGWVVWYPPKIRFKQTDVFGIIDVLALKGRQKKYIQLTTLPNVSAKRKKISGFFKKYKVELTVEIWCWDKKRRNFRKEKMKINKV
jgi:hypothetical protein